MLRIFGLLTLVLGGGAGAQTWRSLGPDSGDRFLAAIDPKDSRVVYVVGEGGIHKSVDQGAHWRPIHSAEMGNDCLWAIAIDPRDHDRIYVGGNRGGVWRSLDGGSHWTAASRGLPERRGIHPSVSSLAVARDGTVYAGVGGAGSLPGVRPVYRSKDRGESWEPLDAGMAPPVLRRGGNDSSVLLAWDAIGGLWAAVYGSGLYRLQDGRWVPRQPVLERGPRQITYVETDPADAARLFVATQRDWYWESRDLGLSWRRLSLPEGIDERAPLPLGYYIKVDPNNPLLLWISASSYGGSNEQPLYRPERDQTQRGLWAFSLDGGGTWKVRSRGTFSSFRMTIDPSRLASGPFPDIRRSKTVYLTSGGRANLLKSDDGGAEVCLSNRGLGTDWTNAVAVDPRSPRRVAAASEGAVQISDDGGRTWSYRKAADTGLYTWSLAFDPQDPGILWYGTGNPSWSWPQNTGLYRADLSCRETRFRCLSDLSRLQWRCPPVKIFPQDGTGAGVWKVLAPPKKPKTLYLATQAWGIYRSDDKGRTWRELNEGIEAAGFPGRSISALALDSRGEPLYAGRRTSDGGQMDPAYFPSLRERGGIYRFDGGRWRRLAGMDWAVYGLAVDPSDVRRVYVATNRGVFYSPDGGSRWERRSRGLAPGRVLPQTVTWDIQLDPAQPGTLYAAMESGIYRSRDGGRKWEPFNAGGRGRVVDALWLDPAGRALYAATLGGSLWRAELGAASGREP